MPPIDNEAPIIDNLFQEMDDIFQGQSYYTVYCHSPSLPWKLFRWKTFKNCMIVALVVLIFTELLDIVLATPPDEMNLNCVGKGCPLHSDPSRGIMRTLYKVIENRDVEEHEGKPSPAYFLRELRHWKPHQDGGPMFNEREDQMKSQASGKMDEMKPPTKKRMPTHHYIYGLFIKYAILVVCNFMIYAISGMFSVARDFFVRHMIATKRRSMISSLFEMRRVVRDDDD